MRMFSIFYKRCLDVIPGRHVRLCSGPARSGAPRLPGQLLFPPAITLTRPIGSVIPFCVWWPPPIAVPGGSGPDLLDLPLPLGSLAAPVPLALHRPSIQHWSRPHLQENFSYSIRFVYFLLVLLGPGNVPYCSQFPWACRRFPH